jgi:hypothetical protein
MMNILIYVSRAHPNFLGTIQVLFKIDRGLKIPLVSKYTLYSQPNLMATLAEIEVFLNGLTIESIDRAIFAFQEGINSRKLLPVDFDPRRAQLACSRILRLTEKRSTAMNNVYEIPKFWINLNGLMDSSNLNIIESYITRAYCMQGALNFHYWLMDIVSQAVKSSLHHTWIGKLVLHVTTAVIQKKIVNFDSANYLPNLVFQIQSNRSYYFLSSILRLWLHFPSDEVSLLQLSLIDIIASNSPSSVLFLDKIWEMYVTPFSTVFNVWNRRSSKTNVEKSLVEFRQQFVSHPFATSGSLENRKLEYLKELIAEWMEYNGLDSDTPDNVRILQECSFYNNLFYIMTVGQCNGYLTRHN